MTPRCAAALCAALAMQPAAGAAGGVCARDRIDIETPENPAVFRVVVADTDAARARGLMGVRTMDADAGMLFTWPDAAPRAFWMKDTPLSLDMLFFDATGRLCGRVDGAAPFSLTPRESGCDAKAVLELVAGTASDFGIRMGAKARHPDFGADAAWPCK